MLYKKYPAFRAELERLTQAQFQEIQALPQDMPHAAFQACVRDILQRYAHLRHQAHERYQVPILQDVEAALAQTGAARYHDEKTVPGRTIQQAVLLLVAPQPGQREPQVKLEATASFTATIPLSKLRTLLLLGLSMFLDPCAWEAISPEQEAALLRGQGGRQAAQEVESEAGS